jgi:hypothetical protein
MVPFATRAVGLLAAPRDAGLFAAEAGFTMRLDNLLVKPEEFLKVKIREIQSITLK